MIDLLMLRSRERIPAETLGISTCKVPRYGEALDSTLRVEDDS
jgi:hypothetical protein